MLIPLLQIDAFTNQPFSGNPAAVCLLESPRDPTWMQNVAAEMNLSETAFVRPLESGFDLRWFTPAVEVDLCGHATLASAHALWSRGVADRNEPIEFHSASGLLTAVRDDERIALDFPWDPPRECELPTGLTDAIGLSPSYIGKSKFDYLVAVESEDALRALQPDFSRLGRLQTRGVIVTSPSNDTRFDFVSRFFAPAAGIDEDPVTGSAHCCLAPFWSERLGKNKMTGYQASARGGIVHVEVQGARIKLSGHAVTVFEGQLSV